MIQIGLTHIFYDYALNLLFDRFNANFITNKFNIKPGFYSIIIIHYIEDIKLILYNCNVISCDLEIDIATDNLTIQSSNPSTLELYTYEHEFDTFTADIPNELHFTSSNSVEVAYDLCYIRNIFLY